MAYHAAGETKTAYHAAGETKMAYYAAGETKRAYFTPPVFPDFLLTSLSPGSA
jgi:hypothetical protein